ncbi:MAG: replicative helicase [Holophagaceae bacterium]|nr:replicative helicase [Holophagaceae bacterium]
MSWMPEKLPEDIDAERSLLATLCSGGGDLEAAELAGYLDPADFVHPGHRAVWEAAVQLLQERIEISPLTLKDAMIRLGTLGQIGEFTGIIDVCTAMDVARPRVLVDILKRHRRRREAIKLGSWLVRHAVEDTDEIGDLIAKAGAHLARIGQGDQKDAGLVHAADFSDEVLTKLQGRMDGRSECGITVAGFSRLNGVTQGFQPGQMIVLASRPGIGKTALALNWALGVLERHRSAAALFSLEMSRDEVYQRLLAAKAEVDLKAMSAAKDWHMFTRVARAKEALDALDLHVCDRAEITAPQITAQVDALLARGHRLDLVVVDYLQLVSSPAGRNRPNEAQRLAEISRALKLLAKDRGLAVVVLSQLNREVEGRAGKRPQLSDLRDSGAIEQDADIVLFIHRDNRPGVPASEEADLIFAKHRNGPMPTIPLRFRGNITRYEELERETTARALLDSGWA